MSAAHARRELRQTSTSNLVAVVKASADAKLLALRPAWDLTLRDYMATMPIITAAETAFFARRADLPRLCDFSGDERMYEMKMRSAIERELQLRAETGLTAAEALQTEKHDANKEIWDQILDMPAHTIEGARLRWEVCQELEGCEQGENLKLDLFNDLLQIVGFK